jgi:hypothetical protein
MTVEGASAPRELGWRGPILALLALTILPITWLRVVTPIEQSVVLLIPALAACALVAWWNGGRAGLALVWVGLAVWTLTRPAVGASAHFDILTRGWSLIVAACFGLVCCLGGTKAFFARALTAVAVALAIAAAVVVATRNSKIGDIVLTELTGRSGRAATEFQAMLKSSPRLTELIAHDTAAAAGAKGVVKLIEEGALRASSVFPALLGLESLLILALAWALFHRLSRVRIGAPLAPLKEFRFNDQLVWGVLLALTILWLPTLDMVRAAGWNLLLFFGGLYAVRGFGVLAWFLSPGRLALTIIITLLLFMFPLLGALAFGLGLGDTWLDWRHRARPTT